MATRGASQTYHDRGGVVILNPDEEVAAARWYQLHVRPILRTGEPCRPRALMLLVLRRWLPDRPLVAITDGEFAALELLHALRPRMTLISRLRRDARLFDPSCGWDRRGRPASRGERQPSLATRTTDPATRWRRVVQASRAAWRSAGWIEYTSGTALWHHPGKPMVPILWVLVRCPDGKREPEAFL